mgnify:CR=1 FL=1
MATDAELLAAWKLALTAHAQAVDAANTSSDVLRAAEMRLAVQLSPTDAKANEVFNVWVADELVTVTNTPAGPRVQSSVRARGIPDRVKP